MGQLRHDLQTLLKQKETLYLKRIEKYCAQHNIEFEDAHDDHDTGIDIILDKMYLYDIKVTDHAKLSYWRKTPTGYEYEPHKIHTRVCYLICLPDGRCYKLSKQTFGKYIDDLRAAGQLDEKTFVHEGDGNYNKAVDISSFLTKENLLFELNDCNDRWSTFANLGVCK